MTDIDSCYARAKAQAQDLGRPDDDDAILDLLLAEVDPKLREVIVTYVKTENWCGYLDGLSLLGFSRRDEIVMWAGDIVREIAGGWTAPAPKRETRIEIKDLTRQPEGTLAIRVYKQVAPEVPESMRWFTAELRGLIEPVCEYYVPSHGEDHVDRHYVRMVEKMHPGEDMWFVYL